MSCKHSSWLRLSRKEGEVKLQATNRPERLIESLPDPDIETPSLILLVGNRGKARALKQLGVDALDGNGHRGHGEVHLFLSAACKQIERPLLLADADIPSHNRLQSSGQPQRCHETIEYSLPANCENASQKYACLADDIRYRMIFPFTDVVCVFIDDLGGIADGVQHVSRWIDKGQPSTPYILPYILFVTEKELGAQDHVGSRELLLSQSSLSPYNHCSKIRLIGLSTWVRLRRSRNYHNLCWDKFNNELYSSVTEMRRLRHCKRMLFSATHLARLLRCTANQQSRQSGPFDFVRGSRSNNTVPEELPAHLKEFLGRFDSLDVLKKFAIPILASSFISDQYVPQMHAFEPQLVFDALYRQPCISVCREAVLAHRNSRHLVLPSSFATFVEKELVVQFEAYMSCDKPAATFHREQLARFRQDWVQVHSEDTCFSCLFRRPMYKLPCGHLLCLNCLKVFGHRDESNLYLDSCLLCGMDSLGFRIAIRPDTASVRVLSIDGGGTRARIPLSFLQEIQNSVGLPCPIQNHFEVAYGTSSGTVPFYCSCSESWQQKLIKSGAISVCGLFINGWPIEDCIASSEALAKLAFKPRSVSQLPLAWLPPIRVFWQILLSLAYDCRYPARGLEEALQRLFGSKRGILDQSAATEMGQFIGMPVTATDDASTYVITNYNGVGNCNEWAGYQHMQPADGISGVPLWKFLRGSTAAPFYFPPQLIEGFGSVQDGGLSYNNPTSMAYQESKRLFPGSRTSIVVSLSTGSARPKGSQAPTSRHSLSDYIFKRWPRVLSRRLIEDSCFARLFRAFVKQSELLSHRNMDHEGELFRFDLEFEGREPRLDNTTELEELGRSARESIRNSPELMKLALCIRAELFFFELDCMSHLPSGFYECVGHLHCRLPPGTPALNTFLDQLDRASATFNIAGVILAVSSQDRYLTDRGACFRQEVRFRVNGRSVPFEITMKEGLVGDSHISGSPFTIDWLNQAQRLDACFGSADHRPKRKRDWEVVREKPKRHKR